jgi:hypothetical protein
MFYVAGNNKTHLGLHVEWPMFLTDFDQLRNFSTDFYRSVFFDPGNSVTRTPHRCLCHGFTSILGLKEIKLLDFYVGREGNLLRKCQDIDVLS